MYKEHDDGCTFINIGLGGAQLLCGVLVRVDLYTEGFLDGEDFEQERETAIGAKAPDDGPAYERGMSCEVFCEELV